MCFTFARITERHMLIIEFILWNKNLWERVLQVCIEAFFTFGRFCGWWSCLTLLSLSSYTCSIGLRSVSGCYVPAAPAVWLWQCGEWHYLHQNLSTISSYVRSCCGWRIWFWYFAVFRFCWKGTIGVFVCIDIPAHIITEPPQKCSFLHTHALLKRSTFCDTRCSFHLIAVNWIWTHRQKNSTPICMCIPQMTSCPC